MGSANSLHPPPSISFSGAKTVFLPIVAGRLFFARNNNRRLGRLLVLFPGHVQTEQILGILRHAVTLPHEKLYELPGEMSLAGAADYLDGEVQRLRVVRGGTSHLQQVPQRLGLVAIRLGE